MPLLRPEGHFWRLARPSPPRAASPRPAHHSNFPPTSGACRWRSGDGGVAARGIAVTPSRLGVPTQQWRTRGQVSVGGRLFWGPGIPQRHPRLPHGSHPTFRGSMRLRGKPSPVGPRGDCPHPGASHTRRRAELYLPQGIPGPSPGPHTFPAPPFTHQCVCCGAIRPPKSPRPRERHLRP
ncbi:hypothetical protein GWK47_042006 [Chionoecetes opilio]|uniref:Uncharacterized protein n=1 Tax=Chionoecetes opilio TaxID=41210 RepID=A0A8J5D0A0_CHIOP|nr:hypothetical protein GWK47_042006 [Chionoecetes opilio]